MKNHISRSTDMLRILRFLANQKTKVGNRQIFTTIGISKRKSQLILNELVGQGFVIKDNGYPCGYKFNQHFREFRNENQ